MSIKIKDQIIAEIGSGNGRIVNMLQELKPLKTFVVEPSTSFEITKTNKL